MHYNLSLKRYALGFINLFFCLVRISLFAFHASLLERILKKLEFQMVSDPRFTQKIKWIVIVNPTEQLMEMGRHFELAISAEIVESEVVGTSKMMENS